MATTRKTIGTAWTDLGTGPLSVGMTRGEIFYNFGPTAPTGPRSSYLHTAQGQTRLISFSQPTTIWGRSHSEAQPVTVITGTLAAANNPNALCFDTYAELPDPSTQDSGQEAIILFDPNDALRGKHVAYGPKGAKAAYWGAA